VAEEALVDREADVGARDLAVAGADPALRTALEGSLHWVFLAMTALALCTLAAAWAMPPPKVEETFRRRTAEPKPAE